MIAEARHEDDPHATAPTTPPASHEALRFLLRWSSHPTDRRDDHIQDRRSRRRAP
ncbi:hypothetical protein [Sphaerisporangium album]|uniref:hypothetical protein n=1 Tax=Sphaerisporangium album TaxID=509200 RepID=UPI0015F03203|nr:hypothetical protein [Sphaerisporangium album]